MSEDESSESKPRARASKTSPRKRPKARARKAVKAAKPKARATKKATKPTGTKPKAKATKKRAATKGAPKKAAARAKRAVAKRAVAKRAGTKRAVTKAEPEVVDEGPIIITGIVGRLGQQVCRVLHRQRSVVGIDRRSFPGRPKDVVHHQVDLRRKKTRDIFRIARPSAVLHLGVLHDPRASDKDRHKWNVVAFQKLLEYVAEYDVPKLVVLSSANVYGPQPDNPQFLTEEAPLLGAQSFRGMRDFIEMDMLAQSFFWKHPSTETVILRPVHILGGVNNAPSNYLRFERPITIMGFDPMVQVIHERDVVRAIVQAVEPGVRGIFNIRGPGELPLSRILRMLGRKPRAVPAFAAKAALERLWKLRLTSFPAPEIDFIRYLCMVDDTRAREVLGFQPRVTLEETIRSVISER